MNRIYDDILCMICIFDTTSKTWGKNAEAASQKMWSEQWKTTDLSDLSKRNDLDAGFPIASEDWNKNHYQAGAMKLAVVGLCLSPFGGGNFVVSKI